MRLLLLLVALQLLVAAPDAGAADVAIVLREAAALRGEARDAKRQRAALSQGDMLEVRGERLDYLNVYDHRRRSSSRSCATCATRRAAKGSVSRWSRPMSRPRPLPGSRLEGADGGAALASHAHLARRAAGP